jgi:hypothetical protein
MKGLSIDEAAARTNKFLFDYSDLSKADRVLKQIIPFWMWTSRNVPLQFENMLMNPKVYQYYRAGKNALQAEQETGFIGDYNKEAGAFQLAEDIPLIGGMIAKPDLGFPGASRPAIGSGGGTGVWDHNGTISGAAGNTPIASPSQGNNGGTLVGSGGSRYGSGGGGASQAGVATTQAGGSSSGGNGTASSLSGASVIYAGGGAGSAVVGTNGTPIGGTGGGGNSGAGTNGGGNGLTNRGSGGGGAGGASTGNFPGGAGGSGIVIIKYLTPVNSTLIFNSSATLTIPTGVTSVDYLVVAGGGAGGGASNDSGEGGGGAGGFLTASGVSVNQGTAYTVTVGGGGPGGAASPANAASPSPANSGNNANASRKNGMINLLSYDFGRF